MDEALLPETNYTFEVRVEKSTNYVHYALQKLLTAYKSEKRGPTMIAVQAALDPSVLARAVPALSDFPVVPVHVSDE